MNIRFFYISLHPYPIQLRSWLIWKKSLFRWRNLHYRFSVVFLFCYNPKKYSSLCGAQTFYPHIGMHSSKIGEKLLYYIYTMKNHHFTWKYVFDYLIGLLLSLIQTQYFSI